MAWYTLAIYGLVHTCDTWPGTHLTLPLIALSLFNTALISSLYVMHDYWPKILTSSKLLRMYWKSIYVNIKQVSALSSYKPIY